MKLKTIPVYLAGFLFFSLGFAFALDSVMGPSYTKEGAKPAAEKKPEEDKKSRDETQEEKASVRETGSDSGSVTVTSEDGKKRIPEKVHAAVSTAMEFVAPATPLKNRMDSYHEMYQKKRAAEKRKEEKKLIAEINANAYMGDGSYGSKRLYLIEQAYKRAREITPVVLPSDKLAVKDSTLLEMLRKDQKSRLSQPDSTLVYETESESETESEADIESKPNSAPAPVLAM